MRDSKSVRMLIVGAGKAGELISRDIKENNSSFEIVGFLDDRKTGEVNGISILGSTAETKKVVAEQDIDELLIAMPSERGEVIRRIVEDTAGQKLEYKILPMLPQVLMQDYSDSYINYVRELRVEDLLGSEISKDDQAGISEFVRGKTIMITGAAGSIGSELSAQIVAHGASRVIFYDWWENGMFELKARLASVKHDAELIFMIGDIKNETKVDTVLKKHSPDAVFHAAAYKHVPLMESNPTEAIKNNIIGTKLLANLSIKNNVRHFILISSDKAVNPTNIMGATKRAAEKVIHILSKDQDTTLFSAVRFGNVINSSGSVIPTFMSQINSGGPVTVTHEDINRFFMTIPEAVHLILQSWVMGENNDLFVLDMGEPVKIYDLAKILISLQGYVPEKDIAIKFTGLRPGEKLFEEVLMREEEVSSTAYDKIFKTKNYMNFDQDNFLHTLDTICQTIDGSEDVSVSDTKNLLMKLVSTYQPKEI